MLYLCSGELLTYLCLMEKNYELPAVVWLKVTDYMHAWMQHELGGSARIRDQRVISVQHLPGAREVLRMETVDDMELCPSKVGSAMSSRRRNMLAVGLELDRGVMEKEYGMTPELMKLFVPVECPKMCMTGNGVLRPWTLDISMGRQQAGEMLRLLRAAFWRAVEDHDAAYARQHEGIRYPAVDMIEDFCVKTGTSDVFVDAIRREWQRRVKRGAGSAP